MDCVYDMLNRTKSILLKSIWAKKEARWMADRVCRPNSWCITERWKGSWFMCRLDMPFKCADGWKKAALMLILYYGKTSVQIGVLKSWSIFLKKNALNSYHILNVNTRVIFQQEVRLGRKLLWITHNLIKKSIMHIEYGIIMYLVKQNTIFSI